MFRDYVWMHVWSAVVASVAVPAWFFVPESPRWLACNKRVMEAEEIIMVRVPGGWNHELYQSRGLFRANDWWPFSRDKHFHSFLPIDGCCPAICPK